MSHIMVVSPLPPIFSLKTSLKNSILHDLYFPTAYNFYAFFIFSFPFIFILFQWRGSFGKATAKM